MPDQRGGGASSPDEVDARRYHLATSVTTQREFTHPEWLLDYTPDPANAALEFNEYDGAPRFDLPIESVRSPRFDLPIESVRSSLMPATRILSGSAGHTEPASLALVSRLLAFSAGVTRVLDGDTRPLYYIASSSAHSHPDLYMVCGDLPHLPAGTYYFHPRGLHLSLLRSGDARGALAAAAADESIAGRPFSIVLAGVPCRAIAYRDSYRERSLRHVYWDVGGLLANLGALAGAAGLSMRVLLGIVDSEVAALLRLDRLHQFPVAIATFEIEGTHAAAGTARPSAEWRDAPIAVKDPVLFPFLTAAHRAGDLGDRSAVERWRARRVVRSGPPLQLPAPDGVDGRSLEEVILTRGSARRMRDDSVARPALTWGLSVASARLPGDWVGEHGTLLEHYAVVHNVDGSHRGCTPGNRQVSMYESGRLPGPISVH